MEANAAMRSIVRKDTGEGYRQMLHGMAEDSGMETPTSEDCREWTVNAQAKSCPTRTGNR